MNVSIFTAKAQLAAVAALFTEAGLDLEAMLKLNDPTALKAHLADLQASAPAPVAITAEHPEVAALITAAVASAQEPLQATIREHGLRLTAINGAIAAAGIQLADTAAPSEIGSSLAAALKAHASKEARALLAAKGFGAIAIADAPNPDPTKPGTGGTKATMLQSEFQALSPAEKMKFSASGGRLLEG